MSAFTLCPVSRSRSTATSAGAGSVPDSIASMNAGGVSTLRPIASVRYPATFSVNAIGAPGYFALSDAILSFTVLSAPRYLASWAEKYAAFWGSSFASAAVAASATFGMVAGSYQTWTFTSSFTPRMSWTLMTTRSGFVDAPRSLSMKSSYPIPFTMTSFESATSFAVAGFASYSCGSALGSLRMLDTVTRDPPICARRSA